MNAAKLLAQHAGHDLTVIDAERTRCLTCSHTLLVKAGRSTITEQDRTNHARPAVCRSHPGELAHACRCCAADAKARPDEQAEPGGQHHPTADVATWAAACRAALGRAS